MQLKRIQVGKWYATRAGVGVVEQVGGTFPPSVRLRIVAPFPRGVVNVVPRDVLKEVDPPAPAITGGQPGPKAPEREAPRCQCFAKTPSGEASPIIGGSAAGLGGCGRGRRCRRAQGFRGLAWDEHGFSFLAGGPAARKDRIPVACRPSGRGWPGGWVWYWPWALGSCCCWPCRGYSA
jgi:hypothetical protein